jgi:hypothetical protein
VRRKQGWLKSEQPHIAERVDEPGTTLKRRAVRDLKLDEPTDVAVGARSALRQAREPQDRSGRGGAKFVDVPLEPTLQLVERDWGTR